MDTYSVLANLFNSFSGVHSGDEQSEQANGGCHERRNQKYAGVIDGLALKFDGIPELCEHFVAFFCIINRWFH